MILTVDGFNFSFPSSWKVSKYDEWAFYRNQFCKIREGIKAVDLIAIDEVRAVWFVEVKDYRVNPRTKPSCLSEEVASKVFDSLAAMLPAKVNASDSDEQVFARAVASALKIRIVLHLEQPVKSSKLFPRAIDPVALQQKLRKRVKSIDAHPVVVEKSKMRGLPWGVT